ncbi:MAG: 3-hydroxyacyl-CoA dehydrogenase NAD-binding domain-containing protein [Cyclobacteriaceae bacterium]
MKRKIKKVAVLGSGIMGSRIACHFANVGLEVLLLDISPRELTDQEKSKNLTLDHPSVKNRIVNESLQQSISSKPSPLYLKDKASLISTGNFDDDLPRIKDADWIIEAIVENLEIKSTLFEKVEKHVNPNAIISSNTSGIPINLIIKDRSEHFQKQFCGAHFFNPPRYLRLLEIIPTKKTDPEIVDFLVHYGDLYLGKETVICKDTPAFIANRIGIYSLMSAMHTIEEMGLSVNEVDKLTGPVIGRPKSATFRTLDVVGLDTAVKVAQGLAQGLKDDESKEVFELPKIVKELYERKWWGDKTKQGYYKKVRNKDGSSEILELDFKSMEYKPKDKIKLDILDKTKNVENLKEKLKLAISATGKVGDFYRKTFYDVFRYSSMRIPEIADDLYQIDQALSAGFGWELGPFATWDVMGVKDCVDQMKKMNLTPAKWVEEMLAAGNQSFYQFKEGKKYFYDIPTKSYKLVPGTEGLVILDAYKESNVVWSNSGATLYDVGDGVLNLEFHTKMNSIGAEVVEGIQTSIEIAEKDFKGLVIGNEGQNFSAGANLSMIFMYAVDQEFDEIDLMIRQFQKTMTRARFSSVPVVSAPSGLALGGGCELSLHCDAIQAHAETYIGLVEFGVGLIPGGGGTKELTLRASDSYMPGDPELNRLQEYFMNIATAKVATSAEEARELFILRPSDRITLNRARLLADAKDRVIELSDAGYTQPTMREDIKVQGRTGMAMFEAGITAMLYGNYVSEHDAKIARKLSYVMNGGDLTSPANVSEQYLLDLEREAFLSLCGEQKTQERIQSILFKGKPLRN